MISQSDSHLFPSLVALSSKHYLRIVYLISLWHAVIPLSNTLSELNQLFPHADTVPPTATIFHGPIPCSNPFSDTFSFEIDSNESPREMQCRLSRWNEAYGDFQGAVDRWSSSTVQLWLQDAKHITETQVLMDLTPYTSSFSSVDGKTLLQLDDAALRNPPLNIDPSNADSDVRMRILNAITNQKQLFESCRSNRSEPTFVKTFTPADLDHGLKLFELRAVDGAGNVGSSVEYIWFVGT